MPMNRIPTIEALESEMIDCWRRMTPQQRLQRAFDFWETARVMTISAVKSQHPQMCEADVLKETAKRLSHGATERVCR